MDFRLRHTEETRIRESSRIFEKFPGRVPCIVQRGRQAVLPPLDKEKFLVPGDLTIGQFIYIIRSRMKLESDKALFVFVGSVLPTTGSLMRELYSAYKEADGFLYLTYCGESTFGV